MGCGGSKSDDVVEAAGVAVKKEKGLTKAQIEKKEEEARLAEEARLTAEAGRESAVRVAEEEAAAKERARIRGCYLCYTDTAQGTLQLVWSETAVEGA